ncbi:MAG: histidine kinase [Bacteroides oleiciplenus]|nr:histidine kinase [Bacteroides oleiciplenus]
MDRQWNRWLAPASFAVILFLCIRVANDIPKHEYYWEANKWDFMLKDMLVVLVMSYPILFSIKCWLRFCRKKRLAWWKEYGVVILGTPFWCLLTMWIIRLLMGLNLDLYDVPIPIVVSILLGGFCYTFLRNQLIQKENEVQRLQLEKIKNDQLQTELKFLKSQYHPHFLFNVLNTVYFQIDEKNEAPRQTLELLSNLLRYQLYNDGEKVQVRVEVEYLKQYIGLCKLRATKRLQLQVSFDEVPGEYEIYPLLFVPLVENAFKYVGGEYCLTLGMYLKDGSLHFDIENSIPESPVPQERKQGIGLENLKRRLELLYQGRHALDIHKGNTLFTVKLVIRL